MTSSLRAGAGSARVLVAVPAAVALAVVAAACGGGDESQSAASRTTASPSGATSSVTPGLPTAEPSSTATATYSSRPLSVSPGPEALPAFDWVDPRPLGMAEWTFRECDAAGRQRVCATRGGGAAGAVEVSAVPVSGRPGVAAARADGGDEAGLRAHAAQFAEDVRADRRQRCGADYAVDVSATQVFPAAGTTTARYGFRATTGGATSEVVVQYAAFVGNRLVVLDVTARDPGGCLPRAATQFTSADLATVLPLIDSLVRVAPFPQP